MEKYHIKILGKYWCMLITMTDNRNKTVVKYTLPEGNNTFFSSEYKLHLPTDQELISAVEEEKKNYELKEL